MADILSNVDKSLLTVANEEERDDSGILDRVNREALTRADEGETTVQLRKGLTYASRQNPEEQLSIEGLANRSGYPRQYVRGREKEIERQLTLQNVDLSQLTPAVQEEMLEPWFTSMVLNNGDIPSLVETETGVRFLPNVAGITTPYDRANPEQEEGFWEEQVQNVGALAAGLLSYAYSAASGVVEAAYSSARTQYEALQEGAEILRSWGIPVDLETSVPVFQQVNEFLLDQLYSEQNLPGFLSYVSGEVQRDLVGRNPDFSEQLFSAGGTLVGQIATYLYSAPLGVVSLFGQGAATQAQIQRRNDRYAQGVGTNLAIPLSGAATLGLEMLGIGKILQVPKGVTNTWVRSGLDVLFSGGVEAGEEVAEVAAQRVIAQTFSGVEDPQIDITPQQAFIAALVGGGARGAYLLADPTARVSEEEASVRQGLSQASSLSELAETARGTELREKAPERYKRFLQKAGAEERQVFIDGPELADILAEKSPQEIDNDPALSRIKQELNARDTEGQDIKVSLSDFLTTMAAADSYSEIQPHLTLTSDALSPARAEQLDTDTRFVDELAEAAEQNEEAKKTLEEFNKIVEDIANRYQSATGQEPQVAKAGAKVAASYITRAAEEAGLSPWAVYQDPNLLPNVRNTPGLKVVGPLSGRPEGEGLRQQGDQRGKAANLLNIPTAGEGRPVDTLKALEDAGVEVVDSTVLEDGRLVVQTEDPLTEEQAAQVEGPVYQRTGTTGTVFNTDAEYDADEFQLPDGTPASERDEGRGKTQFFDDVAAGARDVPYDSTYEPQIPQLQADIDDPESDFGEYHAEYMQHTGNFDDHIALSIPGYRDFQYAIGLGILRTFDNGGTMLDIGASQGSQAKTITSLSNGEIKTISLDPNQRMAQTFWNISTVEGAEYRREALSMNPDYRGAPAWVEKGIDEGPEVAINYFDEQGQKFDIVQESMVFQFIDNDRRTHLGRAAELVKDDGILIVQEKVHTEDFEANEAQKDEYKARSFLKKDLSQKATDTLEGMHRNQIHQVDLEALLEEKFDHVVQIWDSGNFKGYAASNSQQRLQEFSQNTPDTRTPFDSRFRVVYNQEGEAEIPTFHSAPVQEGAESVIAYHFGQSAGPGRGEGRDELDPSMAGTGASGEEADRFGVGQNRRFGDQGGVAARVNFYVGDKDEIPTPEKGVGAPVNQAIYRVKLTNLYNVDEDPLGLRGDGDITSFEQAVSEAGYDGTVRYSQGTAVVFGMGEGVNIPVAPANEAARFREDNQRKNTVDLEALRRRQRGLQQSTELFPFQPPSEAPIFYSRLLRVTEEGEGAPKKAPASAWKQWYSSLQKKGKVGQAELDWLNLDGWLDRQEGKISREDVQAFVRANKLVLEETNLTGGIPVDQEGFTVTEEALRQAQEELDASEEVYEAALQAVENTEDAGEARLSLMADGLDEADTLVFRAAEIVREKSEGDGPPKYEQYTEAGESRQYAEVLVRLPVEEVKAQTEEWWFDRDSVEQKMALGVEELVLTQESKEIALKAYDQAVASGSNIPLGDALDSLSYVATKAEEKAKNFLRELRLEAIDDRGTTKARTFQTGHFRGEKNVAVHIRIDMREEGEQPSGEEEEVAFIEEIQSDWAQEGRKRGFGMDLHIEEVRPGRFEVKDKSGESRATSTGEVAFESRQQAQNAIDRGKFPQKATSPVPDMPFKDTQTWALLGFKRAVRWAIEHGAERVAWTTGEQQANRYDLRNYIDSLEYDPLTHELETSGEGGTQTHLVDPEDLDEYVGQEVAQQIRDRVDENEIEAHSRYEPVYDVEEEAYVIITEGGEPVYNNGVVDTFEDEEDARDAIDNLIQEQGDMTVSMSDLDLEQGGEGMNAFYDQMLPKIVKKWAKQFGSKPYMEEIAVGEDDEAAVHMLDITPEMREAVMAGQPMLQEEGVVKGEFDPDRSVIRMTQAADESTFIHEFAHFMLELERRQQSQYSQDVTEWFRRNPEMVAKDANAQLQKREDADEVSEITVADVEAYFANGSTGEAAKDAAIYAGAHEQFARSFETYLMEGKAPTAALRDVFRKFAAWLNFIYRRVRGDLQVGLDDQMRRVFDQLLTIESEIETASQSDRFKPLFTDATMAGMTEAQWQRYQERQQTQQNEAAETLREKLFRSIQRKMTKDWKAEKSDIIDDILPNIQENQVNTARERLKGDLGMDRRMVKEMVGMEAESKKGKKFTRVPPALNGMTVTGGTGLSPDQAAAILGYDSGAEMLNELMSAPTAKQEAERQAEDIMVQRHGDKLNDGTILREVEAAMENEARAKTLLSELNALGRKQGETDRKQIKELAKERIAQRSYREITPGVYRRAEVRAAKRAQQAVDAGNQEEAAAAKYEQLVNYYLAEEALKARQEIEKKVDKLARFRKSSVRAAVQKGGGGHWEAIQKILRKFEFRKSATIKSVEQQNEALQKWAEMRAAEFGDALMLSPEVLDEDLRVHWKNMPLQDLRGVFDSLKNIEHVARRTNEVLVAEEKEQRDAVVNRMVDKIEQLPKKHVAQRTTTVEKTSVGAQIRSFMADMTKVPWLVSWLDGGERVGLMHDVLTEPLEKAFSDKHKLMESVMEPVTERIGTLSPTSVMHKNRGGKIFIPELQEGRHDGNLTGSQIIAVALHTGNRSNLRKLLVGEGWAKDEEGEITHQNPQLQAVLAHMTREDWDLVDFIWTQMELLYPQLADVYERATGLRPTRVDPLPVETPFGVYTGGYYPMVPDRNRQRNWAPKDDDTEAMFETSTIRQIGVTSSATQERTAAVYPVNLNLDTVVNHFMDSIHYITYHDAVRSVNRIIRDPKFEAAASEALGQDEYRQIPSWLRAVARQGHQTDERRGWQGFLGRLRMGLTYGVMGFKFSTLAAQTLGLSNAAAETGRANMLWALGHIAKDMSHFESAMAYVMENSKVMPHRINTFDRDAKSALDKVQGTYTKFSAVQEASLKGIGLFQLYTVDLPTWWAAYRKEMKSSGDETQAIRYADWAVENVQGSGRVESMAAIMRDRREEVRIFTQFMTFFSSLWNAQRDLVRGAKTGRYGVTDITARALFMFVIPTLVDEIMRNGLVPEEDEDWSDQAWYMIGRVGLTPLATVPLLRTLSSPLLGYDYTLAPVASVFNSLATGWPALAVGALSSEEEITPGEVKKAFYSAGVLLHIPGTHQIWGTASHIREIVAEGEDLAFRELAYGAEED